MKNLTYFSLILLVLSFLSLSALGDLILVNEREKVFVVVYYSNNIFKVKECPAYNGWARNCDGKSRELSTVHFYETIERQTQSDVKIEGISEAAKEIAALQSTLNVGRVLDEAPLKAKITAKEADVKKAVLRKRINDALYSTENEEVTSEDPVYQIIESALSAVDPKSKQSVASRGYPANGIKVKYDSKIGQWIGIPPMKNPDRAPDTYILSIAFFHTDKAVVEAWANRQVRGVVEMRKNGQTTYILNEVRDHTGWVQQFSFRTQQEAIDYRNEHPQIKYADSAY